MTRESLGSGHHDALPPLPLYLTECGRGLGDLAMYVTARPFTRLMRGGDGHPVLVMPGLLANDASTLGLRRVLERLGYETHGWGLGRNIGPTDACMRGMRDNLRDLAGRHNQPVSVVGWSLGGIFARMLASESPDSVRQVITLASPFRLSSTTQSRAHRVFERYSHLHVEGAMLPTVLGLPLAVPTTSIYSRMDGIVPWRSCLETPGPHTDNIGVHASHMGITHNPAAIYAVADRLAQPIEEWRPFEPPAPLRLAFQTSIEAPRQPCQSAAA